jgi:hypothetical protein
VTIHRLRQGAVAVRGHEIFVSLDEALAEVIEGAKMTGVITVLEIKIVETGTVEAIEIDLIRVLVSILVQDLRIFAAEIDQIQEMVKIPISYLLIIMVLQKDRMRVEIAATVIQQRKSLHQWLSYHGAILV